MTSLVLIASEITESTSFVYTTALIALYFGFSSHKCKIKTNTNAVLTAVLLVLDVSTVFSFLGSFLREKIEDGESEDLVWLFGFASFVTCTPFIIMMCLTYQHTHLALILSQKKF